MVFISHFQKNPKKYFDWTKIEKFGLYYFVSYNCKMKEEVKELSGSVKIDPDIYRRVMEYCQKNGLKITFFASEALAEKLSKVEKEKK